MTQPEEVDPGIYWLDADEESPDETWDERVVRAKANAEQAPTARKILGAMAPNQHVHQRLLKEKQ